LGLKVPARKAVKIDVKGRRVKVEVECAGRAIRAAPEKGNAFGKLDFNPA
jgi:hypothetical protein